MLRERGVSDVLGEQLMVGTLPPAMVAERPKKESGALGMPGGGMGGMGGMDY
jgi:hypothetical protein